MSETADLDERMEILDEFFAAASSEPARIWWQDLQSELLYDREHSVRETCDRLDRVVRSNKDLEFLYVCKPMKRLADSIRGSLESLDDIRQFRN
jgi:hypothetical protein